MAEPVFLDRNDILYIHGQEIDRAGGDAGVRDPEGIDAAVGAPQATFGGEFLMDLFDMAASCLTSLVIRHPFLDGNKRTGTAAALTFLYLNGYEVRESHGEEIADFVLSFLRGDVKRNELGEYFRTHARPRRDL